MFFILSKILDVFLTPINWVFVLLLFSFFFRKVNLKRRFLIIACSILYFCSNYTIVNFLWQSWEKDPIVLDGKTTFDVAIILTGITDNIRMPQDRIYLKKGAERITTPIILYKKGTIKKILITGGSGSIKHNAQPEAEILRRFLIDNNVNDEDIIIENQSLNTHQNALFTKEKLNQYPKLEKKLLITSAFHMRRSVACFKIEGVRVTPYPVDFYSSNSNTTFAKLFIPNTESLNHCTILIHEVVGYLVYKVVGYA